VSNSIWIITTVVLGFTTVLGLGASGVMWLFAKKEGRHFLGKIIGKKGVDMIRHQPMSNKLSLISPKYKEKIWSIEKEGMLFGMNLIENPTKETERSYNSLVKRSCTWEGAGTPVVIATDVMSTMITPAFYAAVAKMDSFKQYPKAKNVMIEVAGWAAENDLDVVTHMETINPATLKEHLKDIGPKHMRDIFKKGIETQKLADTKIKGEGMDLGGGWWILVLMVLALLGIGYAISSGMLDGLL
jgi:hypothetical protein